ncbi:MAG TPA: phage holin family protein [Marmoricola sp.]
MAHREPVPATDEEPTIGKLVADASRDVSSLMRAEIQLAKSELSVSIKTSGIAIALFALAGFLLLLAIIMVSVAIAYFIHMADLDLAWCFLIVFGGYVLLALVLGLIGFLRIRKVRGPERAIAQAKQIPAALKPSA